MRENELQVNAIREGLFSVIPPSLIGLFSWQDLEQLVCGRPTIDLTILKRHTTYSPPFTETDDIIMRFWRVLEGFTEEERLSFVRFAWARSRLPAEDGSYRMRINIVKVGFPTLYSCLFGYSFILTSPHILHFMPTYFSRSYLFAFSPSHSLYSMNNV